MERALKLTVSSWPLDRSVVVLSNRMADLLRQEYTVSSPCIGQRKRQRGKRRKNDVSTKCLNAARQGGLMG
jgi:hypothetical protein